MSDTREYNRKAWNQLVDRRNQWTVPVGSSRVEQARCGEVRIRLTPQKSVPDSWFPDLKDCQVLGLASGGGQQGPLLAAAGADVTILDYSDRQLEQDEFVARREDLNIKTVQGDMADLSLFEDEQFDFVVHPCSNTFVPDVRPVWREAARVLRKGGTLISGFCNPLLFLFDYEKSKQGQMVVRHQIPYSDAVDLTEVEKQRLKDEWEPFCYGHTLGDLIGGQCAAGFQIADFYEDRWNESGEPIDQFIECFIATRAIKR